MNKSKPDWAKWTVIVALAACLLGCVAWIGRGVDVIRMPERADKIETHLDFTDGRVTRLEQHAATNDLTVIFLIQELGKKIDAFHRDFTN